MISLVLSTGWMPVMEMTPSYAISRPQKSRTAVRIWYNFGSCFKFATFSNRMHLKPCLAASSKAHASVCPSSDCLPFLSPAKENDLQLDERVTQLVSASITFSQCSMSLTSMICASTTSFLLMSFRFIFQICVECGSMSDVPTTEIGNPWSWRNAAALLHPPKAPENHSHNLMSLPWMYMACSSKIVDSSATHWFPDNHLAFKNRMVADVLWHLFSSFCHRCNLDEATVVGTCDKSNKRMRCSPFGNLRSTWPLLTSCTWARKPLVIKASLIPQPNMYVLMSSFLSLITLDAISNK